MDHESPQSFLIFHQPGGALPWMPIATRLSLVTWVTWVIWISLVPPRSRANRGSCRVALCANKLDLGRRAVSRAEGEDFAASHGMRYFETSAATGEQVTEAGWSMPMESDGSCCWMDSFQVERAVVGVM